MFHHRPSPQTAHFHLYETAQVARSAMDHAENGEQFLLEFNHHARAELCCRNHLNVETFHLLSLPAENYSLSVDTL